MLVRGAHQSDATPPPVQPSPDPPLATGLNQVNLTEVASARALLVARARAQEIDKRPKFLKKLCKYRDFFAGLNLHLGICKKFLTCWWESEFHFQDDCRDPWILAEAAVTHGETRSQKKPRKKYWGYRSRDKEPCRKHMQDWLLNWSESNALTCPDLRKIRWKCERLVDEVEFNDEHCKRIQQHNHHHHD